MATSKGKGQKKNHHPNMPGFLEKVKPSKGPIGAQIKRVIDLLKETRQPGTQEEIIESCNVEKSVFQNLERNPRINKKGNYYSYKAKHELSDAYDLLNFLQKFPEGIDVTELEDSYPNVMQDLKEFKEKNKIWVLTNMNKQEIVYPNDVRYHDVKVDDDLKKLYREMELPVDFVEVEENLKKNGMRPATDTKRRMAMAKPFQTCDPKEKKRKKGEITNKTKITNFHLPELFFK